MSSLNTIFRTETHIIKSEGVLLSDNRTEYSIESLSLAVNAKSAQKSIGGDYIASIGDSVAIYATIKDGGEINHPGAIMKLPVVRYADNVPTDDEIYWDTTIENGLMTATGSFPRSGAWVFSAQRINQALQRSGIDWKITSNDITFLI